MPVVTLTGYDDAFPACFRCFKGEDMGQSGISNVDETRDARRGDVVDNAIAEYRGTQIEGRYILRLSGRH